MAHIGKRVVKGREGIDRTKLYPLTEAVGLVKAWLEDHGFRI